MNVRTWTRPTALVAMAVIVLGLSACASRPSADVLTQSILQASESQAIQLSAEQAECIADALIGSELADVTVTGLAENFDEPEVAVSDAGDVESVVAGAAVTCSGN